jgi:hypothetical protein
MTNLTYPAVALEQPLLKNSVSKGKVIDMIVKILFNLSRFRRCEIKTGWDLLG